MRKRLFTPCIIVLFFLLLFSQMDAGAETGGKIPEGDPLSYMPKDITLGDALRKYPEIQDYYPLKALSKEEAEAYIAKGVRVISDINADDILAIPFLEQINYVSYPSDTSSDNSFPQLQNRGGWAYQQQNGIVPNCYSYAVGVYNKAYNPGGIAQPSTQPPNPSLPSVLPTGALVEDIPPRVNSDMAVAFNGGARIIGANNSIYSYEWRVACRVGAAIITYGNESFVHWDYHFWLQTYTGAWCHKPGKSPSQYLGYVTPHTANWDKTIVFSNGTTQTLSNFYDSDTIYLALHSQ